MRRAFSLLLSLPLLLGLSACESAANSDADAVGIVVDAANDAAAAIELAEDIIEAPASFLFAVLSDTHLMVNEDEPRNAMFVEAGQLFSTMDPAPAFVVSTGDNIEDLFCLPSHTAEDAELPILTLYRSLIEAHYAMPFYAVLGNHDNRYFDTFAGNEDAWRAWIRAFEGTETLPAPYYAVDHGGFRFLMLACTDEATDHDSNDRCTIGDEQLAWLEAQLAEGLPSVLFWHHTMVPPEQLDASSHVLFHTIAAHEDTVRAVFTGHRHRFSHFVWLGIDFWETDAFKGATELPYHIVRCDPADGSALVANEAQWQYVTE